MVDKLLTILGYTIGIIGAIIITPFVLVYYLVLLFWKIFGATILAYIILTFMGLSEEDCLKYSAGLGFFIGIYWKYKELKNK
jgi:hypothetical protein